MKNKIHVIAPLFIALSIFNTFSHAIETEDDTKEETSKLSLLVICKDYPYCKMTPKDEEEQEQEQEITELEKDGN
jgi:hypothetical protein